MSKIKSYIKDIDYKNMSWCLKNDIKIYFEPLDNTSGRIIIIEKQKKYIKQEVYRQPSYKKPLRSKDKKWWVDVMNLYTEYYNKYNNEKNEIKK